MIEDFDEILNDSTIVVVDNPSTDTTSSIAQKSLEQLKKNKGVLLNEHEKGKSLALRKAIITIPGDVYLMCDADCTYSVKDSPKLIEAVEVLGYEMAVANRHGYGDYERFNSRKFHNFGNKAIQKIVNALYGSKLEDTLSGFRAMSKTFFESYPQTAVGFELEADLTLHALDKRMSILEIPSGYQERPEGSLSKLRTFQDGFRIINVILRVFLYYRPLTFFGYSGIALISMGAICGIVPIHDYISTRYVNHIPLAILASSLVLLGVNTLFLGLIIDSINDLSRRIFGMKILEQNRYGK